jgi:hypothetical protein
MCMEVLDEIDRSSGSVQFFTTSATSSNSNLGGKELHISKKLYANDSQDL